MAEKKDSEVEALKARIAELEAAKPAQLPGRPGFKVTGARQNGSKEVKAAHNEKPKTYIALENGTDHIEGFIQKGRKFTTTQPQGSWMEEVKDEAPAKSKKDD